MPGFLARRGTQISYNDWQKHIFSNGIQYDLVNEVKHQEETETEGFCDHQLSIQGKVCSIK